MSTAPSIFRPYPYQRKLIKDPARFLLAIWSRQTGKSAAAALKINLDILDAEACGGQSPWTVVSQTKDQARGMARKIRNVGRAVCAARKLLQPRLVDLGESQFELTYPGGSIVTVRPASSAAGGTGNLLCDELDLWPRQREAWGTVFPVASREQWKVIVLTTPRGHRLAYELYKDAQAADGIWSAQHLTIHQAIEQGCPQDAEVLRRALRDPQAWRQEYLCEFVDEATAFLAWDLITACTDESATVEPGPSEQPVFAGWDVARYHHLSSVWIAQQVSGGLRPLGLLRMRDMTFAAQRERVTRTLRRYPRFRRLAIDEGGMGEGVVEDMRAALGSRVEGVKFQGIKDVLAGELRNALEDRRFGVFDDDEVRQDLHCVRQTPLPSGKSRFEGEVTGSHADIFWSAALCVHAAHSGGQAWIAVV